MRAGTWVSHSPRHPWQTAQARHGGGLSNYLPSDWTWNYPVPVSPTCCPPAKLTLGLWLLGKSGSLEPTPPASLSISNLYLLGLSHHTERPRCSSGPLNTHFYRISDSLTSRLGGHTKCFVKLTAPYKNGPRGALDDSPWVLTQLVCFLWGTSREVHTEETV